MAKDREIELIIAPDGSVTVEGKHYEGPACDAELRRLAEALGVVQQVTKKPEYDRVPVAVRAGQKVGG
mgnify:CR=1 FL=1